MSGKDRISRWSIVFVACWSAAKISLAIEFKYIYIRWYEHVHVSFNYLILKREKKTTFWWSHLIFKTKCQNNLLLIRNLYLTWLNKRNRSQIYKKILLSIRNINVFRLFVRFSSFLFFFFHDDYNRNRMRTYLESIDWWSSFHYHVYTTFRYCFNRVSRRVFSVFIYFIMCMFTKAWFHLSSMIYKRVVRLVI